jgi:hypothetical protein
MGINKKCMYKAALGSWAELGFDLADEADDFAVLTFKGKVIGRYNQTKVIPEMLQRDCKAFWDDQLNIFTNEIR